LKRKSIHQNFLNEILPELQDYKKILSNIGWGGIQIGPFSAPPGLQEALEAETVPKNL
jgi:hypothetical protein